MHVFTTYQPALLKKTVDFKKKIDGYLKLQKSRFTISGYLYKVLTPSKKEIVMEPWRAFKKYSEDC